MRGSADARLLPFPSVTFSDVAIGEDDNGQPLMTVARFSMDAELAPFLRGEILIFDMRLERPSVTLRILPDGQLDWALRHRPATPGETVVLEKVSITEADIRIVDEQNDRSHYVQSVDAVASAKSLSGPWIVEGRARILGRTGAFTVSTGAVEESGKVRLRTRVRPDDQPVEVETEGDARIVDGKPRYDGAFVMRVFAADEAVPDGAPPKTRAIARGAFEADNERLRIAEYRLEMGAGTDPYVVTGEATIDTGPNPEFLLTADGQQVDVNRLGSEEANGKTSRRPASLPERLAQLTAFLAELPPPPLPGRIDVALPAIVAGDTTIRDIRFAARPADQSWQIDHLAASLPGRTRVEADGLLQVGETTAFSGNLLVASNQPSGLANWLSGEVDPVIRRIADAGFSAKVSLTPRIQRFEGLELAIGPAILKGSLERQTPEGQTPSLSLALKGDRFDVDAVRALSALAGVGRSDGADWLGVRNLSAQIEADVLSLGAYEIGGVSTTLLWRDGVLTLDRLRFADLAGASGNLAGTLSGSLANLDAQVEGRIESARADGLLSVLSRLSAGHPVVERLRVNAGAFDGLGLDVELKADEREGASLRIVGVAGGTRIDLTVGAGDLASILEQPKILGLRADNAEAWRLMEQAGFGVLPLDELGGAGLNLILTAIGKQDRAVEARLSIGDSDVWLGGSAMISADREVRGEFDVTLKSPDLEPVLLLFGQPVPQAGIGLPVDFTARMALTPEAIDFADIAGTAAGNAASGSLRFNRRSPGIEAEGALKLAQADLGWFGELALGPRDAGIDLDIDGGAWSDTPFLPPSQGAPSFSVALEAGRFSLGGAGVAEGFSANVSVRPGALSMSNVSAGYMGGQLSGEFNLNNPDGTAYLSGKLRLADADLGQILRATTGTAVASAKAVLEASIEGTGASPRALVAALSGGGELTLSGLVIEGLNPAALGPILAEADGAEAAPDAEAVAALAARTILDGRLPLGEIRLPFTLSGGAQRFSTASAAGGPATLSGDGRIDLTSLEIESLLTLAFDPGREALAGAEPAVAIAVEGPIADPQVHLDAAALANYLSMRAFERERRKVELLQAGVIEKQRMRRELGLLAEAAERREREAQRAREAEAARIAAEKARIEAEAAAARAAEERRAAEARAAAQKAAEAAARKAAEEAARRAGQTEIERKSIDPPAPAPTPGTRTPPLDLDFDTLPGVPDPAGEVLSPGGAAPD